MNATLRPDDQKLARYYGTPTTQENYMLSLAHLVADGSFDMETALDMLAGRHVQMTDGPQPPTDAEYEAVRYWDKDQRSWVYTRDLDYEYERALEDIKEPLHYRLETLVDRIQAGQLDAPIAVVTPGADPRALAGLGIEPDGILSPDEINALLAGLRTDGAPVEGKHYAKERALPVDPKTREQRHSTPIGSYDFCPTPDKSASVAWAFAKGPAQAAIYDAHIEAAREAVAYLKTEIGQASLGKRGEHTMEPGHTVSIEFTHHTARKVQIKDGGFEQSGAGDPDLHTHFLIPNAVFCDNGKVGSLDTAAIRGFIFEADAYYHALFAQNLRGSGFEAELDHKTGAARMPVVPDDARTLFSKRTNAGEALAKSLAASKGVDWEAISPSERATRIKEATQHHEQKQKGGKDDVADFDDWRRQAKDIGWEPKSLYLYGPPPPPLTLEQRHRKAYQIALPWLDEQLQQKAVLTSYDVRRAALRGLIETGLDGLDDIKAVTKIMATEGILQNGQKTALAWGQDPEKRHVSITTVLHRDEEREFVRLARSAAADKSGAIPKRLLQEKIAASGLDFVDEHGRAQKQAIERLGQGGRLGVVIGAAGMGKTSAVIPLAAAWGDMGRDVWGTSLAWRQTDDLALRPTNWSHGIDQRRTKAFSVLMKGIEAGEIKLTDKSVVVVDEWGMLGTRSGLALLRAREKYGFSIVALGDDRQCQSVEAGALIDLSRRALGAENIPEILTTKRQRTERERAIVGLFREGLAADALDMKRADGNAELAKGGREGVIARVAQLYANGLKATGDAPTISAPTNRDAHDISAAVRQERRKMGLVGADVMTVKATDGTRDYDLALAPGDRVRLFRSTGAKYPQGKGGSIGRNGTVLEVVAASDDGVTLRGKSGKVGLVDWDDLTVNGRVQLAYGDAMTINTAQGSSSAGHISAFPDGAGKVLGQQAYASLTRHFWISHMVTSEQAEHQAVQRSRPLNDPHPITNEDLWAQVAKSFANQPEKDSATALAERAGRLKVGAMRALHHVLTPAQPGQGVGDAPSMAGDIVQDHRLRAAMQKVGGIAQEIKQSVTRTVRHVQEHYGPRIGL